MTITLITICLVIQPALIEPPTDWQMFNRFCESYLTDDVNMDFNNDEIVNYIDWLLYERKKMRIELSDDIVLSSNTHNFILNTKIPVNKKNSSGLQPYGFYSTLCGAIQGFVKAKRHQSTATTLKMLCREQEALYAALREKLEPDITITKGNVTLKNT